MLDPDTEVMVSGLRTCLVVVVYLDKKQEMIHTFSEQ